MTMNLATASLEIVHGSFSNASDTCFASVPPPHAGTKTAYPVFPTRGIGVDEQDGTDDDELFEKAGRGDAGGPVGGEGGRDGLGGGPGEAGGVVEEVFEDCSEWISFCTKKKERGRKRREEQGAKRGRARGRGRTELVLVRKVEQPSGERTKEERKLAVLYLPETGGGDGDEARHVLDGDRVEVAKDREDGRRAARSIVSSEAANGERERTSRPQA